MTPPGWDDARMQDGEGTHLRNSIGAYATGPLAQPIAYCSPGVQDKGDMKEAMGLTVRLCERL